MNLRSCCFRSAYIPLRRPPQDASRFSQRPAEVFRAIPSGAGCSLGPWACLAGSVAIWKIWSDVRPVIASAAARPKADRLEVLDFCSGWA
jgi:hypothetical protein